MYNKHKKEHFGVIKYIFTLILFMAAATGVGWLFRLAGFPETNIVVVYILSVLLTARFTKTYIYGIASSVIATIVFNYFFTEPYYTLSVNDPAYFITFVIMTMTALVTSALTSKVKQSAIEAREKEEETAAMYRLTNRLTDAANISDIAGIAVSTISDIMGCCAACLCFDENGQPEKSFIQQKESQNLVHRKFYDDGEIKHRMEQLRTAYDVGGEFYDWPIYGRDAVLGVLRIPIETAEIMNETQKRLLRSMIESTALAMDRFRSVQERIKSREEAVQEHYRGNLLRAISHDLRTPLFGIIGTSEILMDMIDEKDSRYALAEDIYNDADWLHSLVENILSLTRLHDGKLALDKRMEAVEEVVGVAVAHMAKRVPGREISVYIPDEVLLVPMDAKLIEQTLVNLLDNAIKATPYNKEINISVKKDMKNSVAVFTVADRGRGIVDQDLEHIFQMFYTTRGKGADSNRGVGLGLAICESIVKAHGGTIEAHNREDREGAEFVFTLPMEVD